jgi:large subunit ribosomal protein L9
MKVILLENLKGLGQIGDVKSVADGYGRNFLLPQNKAKLVTSGSVKEIDALKKKLATMIEAEKNQAEEAAKKFKDTVLEFYKKATKTGKTYSSVTKEEIAEKLSGVVGFKVEAYSVDLGKLGEHIKQLGEHPIEVSLAPDVKMSVKIKVNAE